MPTETTESIIREAPEIEAHKLGLLRSAKALSNSPQNIPPHLIAGLTGLQNSALGKANSGIGGYQNYLDQAGYTLGDARNTLQNSLPNNLQYRNQAANYFNQGAGGIQGTVNTAQNNFQGIQNSIGGIPGELRQGVTDVRQTLGNQLADTTGAFNPQSIQNFYNPYEDQLINQSNTDIARAGNIQEQRLNAQAVGAGAFGGARQGIQNSDHQRNVLEQQARTASGIRQSGYESARGAAQSAYEQQRSARQNAANLYSQAGFNAEQMSAGAGLNTANLSSQLAGQQATAGFQGNQQYSDFGQNIGNLGYNYGNQAISQGREQALLGTQQAGIGQLQQQLGQQEQGFLYDLGKQQQAHRQAGLDATRQTSLERQYEPHRRLSFLSDIYKGAPSSTQSISGISTPSISPAQTYLGLGISGLAATAAAKREGIL